MLAHQDKFRKIFKRLLEEQFTKGASLTLRARNTAAASDKKTRWKTSTILLWRMKKILLLGGMAGRGYYSQRHRGDPGYGQGYCGWWRCAAYKCAEVDAWSSSIPVIELFQEKRYASAPPKEW
eukprot:IDg9478t1